MSGTRKGGLKAARTNKLRYGNTYYHEIGKDGGQASSNGGFASDKVGPDGLTGAERAITAGIKGGMLSRRGKKEEVVKDKKRFVFWEEL